MGFIDKRTLTIDAILTRAGREYMRKAVSGNTTNEHVISKFALGDDEIDYSLWDTTPSGSNFVKPFGQVIDNMPITEAVVSSDEIMNSYLTKKDPNFSILPEVPEVSTTDREAEDEEREREIERERRERMERREREQEREVRRQDQERGQRRREQQRRRDERNRERQNERTRRDDRETQRREEREQEQRRRNR